MIEARFKLDDYTSRVLDVIKGKFGLKNRNEALKKFADTEGYRYLEPIANEKTLNELDSIFEEHKRKNLKRRMSNKQLKQHLGL